MLEVGDQYIGAEIMLPGRDKMARDYVVLWSHDTGGNIIGSAHANPIMDTILYQVEFAGGKITELTAELMYTQCNADGNEYLHLDALVDYCKDNKAIPCVGQTSIL